MTKKTVHKKSNKTSFKTAKDMQLSIQFSLDGFSFCVLDLAAKKNIYFSNYPFKETLNTPEELLQKVAVIFKEDANLQLEYNTILVIHQNNLSTLVPAKYFDKNALEAYLNLNIKTLKTDFIDFDSIHNTDIHNVYIPYVNMNNYVFQNFGTFEYKHHSTILLEKLLALKFSEEKKMYINVHNNTFDLVVIEKKKLILYNSFSYNTKEDFLYYILFTAEQIALDPEDFKLFFTGNIFMDSDLYKITYKYIKNIFFLSYKNPLIKDLKISNHTNFILLG